jgi:UDPglucose--hexose-1-phosphate uridylyltransferase
LEHPHSQIVVAPVVPPQVRRQFDIARSHYDDFGTCLYLDMVERELADGSRIVIEGPRVVAFQPFAASAAYETWLMPRFQQASFGNTDDETLDELAHLLHDVLAALRRHLDDPPYNLVLHSAPPGDEGRAFFSWHIQIVPRLSTPAGFELATGMSINPALPEETAAALRATLAALPPN